MRDILRHSVLLLGIILFIGAISLISCGDTKPIKLKHNTLPISIVYPPNLTPLVRQLEILFGESTYNALPDGSSIELNLIPDQTFNASSKISAGRVKIHGWIAPSTSVVNYTNSRQQNLGPQQIDCAQLFATPMVVATLSQNLSNLKAEGNQVSWKNLFSFSPDGDLIGNQYVYNRASPLSSDSGLANLIQAIYIATDFPGIISREKVDTPIIINKLRAIESGVASYAFSDKSLLAQLVNSRSNKILFSLTTEQEVALFNQERIKTGKELVTALYPKEGTAWLDYNLCLSDADWVTPAHRRAINQLMEYLRLPAPQQLAVSSGLRPAMGSVPLTQPLTSQHKVDISKGTNNFLPVSGDIVERLVTLWPELLKPTGIMFVLDTSGSMEGTSLRLGKTYIRNTIAGTRQRDLKGLITSSTKVSITSEFTADGALIIPKLDQLKAQGGSSIYDALIKAMQLIQADELKQFRKTILVYTDGGDKNSDTPLPRLRDITHDIFSRHNINLIIVAVGKDEDFSDLKLIAEAANGVFIEADYDDLADIFTKIRSIL